MAQNLFILKICLVNVSKSSRREISFFARIAEQCQVLYKKGVLKNLTKFIEKHLRQSFLFNKVTGLRPATL